MISNQSSKPSRKQTAIQKGVMVMALIVATLALAGTALAASGGGSLVTVYGGSAGNTNTKVTNTPTKTATPAATSKSTLPFTGLDVGIVIAGGLLLLVVGAGLRRTGRKTA